MEGDLRSHVLSNEMAVASAAMYFYDWIVTLDVEVEYIWVCKWTLSTWIFLVNRYATLVDAMLLLYLNPNRQICTGLVRTSNVLQLLVIVASALFTALRAYALYNRSILVCVLVFGLCMVPFVTGTITAVTETPWFSAILYTTICQQARPFTNWMNLGLSLGARIALIIADFIVLAVTLRKVFRVVRPALLGKTEFPVSEVLFRDGILCFLGLLFITVCQVVMVDMGVAAPINAIFPPLGSILVSRFMLDLRAATRHSTQSTDLASQTTIQFNSTVDTEGVYGGSELYAQGRSIPQEFIPGEKNSPHRA